VVGDDDQSIYGWRGAQVSNILDMEKHYPEVKLIRLEQNYRSTNTILSAANAVITRNVRRRGKRLWSAKGQGTKISVCGYESDEAEARSVVEQIEYQRIARRIPWSQQAILFRTNAQSRPLETALRQAGVRYHLIGGQSFFDRREIRDFLAYLKLFVNPHDDVSLLRVANVPPRGLSDVTMERLLAASQERKCSVFAAMKNPAVTTTFLARTREAVERLVALVESTRQRLHHPAAAADPAGLRKWASQFLEETGLLQDLRRGEKTPEAGENRVRNIQEMAAELDGADGAAAPLAERLQTFLEEITLETDREEEEAPAAEAVTLITMHSCKGLEFPHVHIVGLEDGLLPHTRSKEEQTVDEERRLFYVAITRAMETLSISHCATRKKYGAPVPCHPSPFLKALPEELVEDGDQKAKAPVTVESGKSGFAAMRAALDLE
jgi:superfamily I DNA/RNA helicase